MYSIISNEIWAEIAGFQILVMCHDRVGLLKMQCVMEDGSLSIEEKLAMIDAINGYNGA